LKKINRAAARMEIVAVMVLPGPQGSFKSGVKQGLTRNAALPSLEMAALAKIVEPSRALSWRYSRC